jgi:glycosyltransferase involved in cell wall biosynthesis
VLLGDGPLLPEVNQTIKRLNLSGTVHLHGFKQYSELPSYYGLAGAFVHASTSEQWGLVVNEAMAAGLPVIVSDRCGCAPDLVADGVNGYTFPPHDPDALAERLCLLTTAESTRATMGKASRDRIADWGPEAFAYGLEHAAHSALEAPSPSPNLLTKMLLNFV